MSVAHPNQGASHIQLFHNTVRVERAADTLADRRLLVNRLQASAVKQCSATRALQDVLSMSHACLEVFLTAWWSLPVPDRDFAREPTVSRRLILMHKLRLHNQGLQ